MRIFDTLRRLAVAAHFLIAIAVLSFTLGALNSGVDGAAVLYAVLLIVFSAPLIPMSMRTWRRWSSSATTAGYVTRTGSTLGTLFGVVGLVLLLFAAGLGGDGEDRLGAALGAMLALWLSSLSMELSRRRG